MKISQAEATLVNLVGSLKQLLGTTPDDRALGSWLLNNAAGLKRLHRCKPDILAFIGGELPVAVTIPTRKRPKPPAKAGGKGRGLARRKA